MPRTYIKKTDRSSIDEREVKKAIVDIFNNVRSIKGASAFYNIKRQTLQSRIKKITASSSKEDWLKKAEDSGQESEEDAPLFANKYAARQVFTVVEEQKLSEYIKNCSELHYGMNYTQIQELSFEYATRLGKDMPANWKLNGLAGIEWIRGFIGRQKNLSLRKPESTSLARAKGFNKVAVDDFFDKYMNVLEKEKFTARQIFNIDECGVTTVMKPVKIVAEKGKKQVGIATSAERGELVTFVGIINAAGGFLPPCYVFPRLRNPQEYLRDEYPDSIALGSKNGWMTRELFPVVIDHIIKFAKPTKEDKILLLLDNHDSHISLQVINKCRENGIVLLSFPPHTTHRLQPLDVGVYSPFKTACAKTFHQYQLSNPGRRVTIREIAMLTKKAVITSFTPGNIVNAFKKTGLWPVNPMIFSSIDFKASEVAPECSESTSSTSKPSITPVGQQEATTPSADKLSPEDIRPYPKILSETPRRNTGKSRVYTDSPEKNRIGEIEKNRIEKCAKKLCQNKEKERTQKRKTRPTRLSESDEDHPSSKEDEPPSQKIRKLQTSQYAINDFVVINYNQREYPGQIIDISTDGAKIKCLEKGLKCWRWPEKDDVGNYEWDVIVGQIDPPRKGKRNQYLIPELDVFSV